MFTLALFQFTKKCKPVRINIAHFFITSQQYLHRTYAPENHEVCLPARGRHQVGLRQPFLQRTIVTRHKGKGYHSLELRYFSSFDYT